MNKFIKKHYLKLVSVFLGTLIWAISSQSINPDKIADVTLNLTLINEDALTKNHYILANKSEILSKKVRIWVKYKKANESEFNAIKEKIQANIDLSPIELITNRYGEKLAANIHYEFPVGKYTSENILRTSDYKVELLLDKLIEKEFNITTLITGKPADGYLYTQMPKITPTTVVVSGAESVVKTVNTVTVTGDIQDKSTDFVEYSADIKVTDFNGNDITSKVALSRKSAKLEIPIFKIGTIIINPPTYTGNVATGYEISSVDFDPKHISVVGSESVINGLENIDLPLIDLSQEQDTTKDIVKTFDLSETLSSRDIKPSYDSKIVVTVTLKISKIDETTLTIPQTKFIVSDTPADLSVEILTKDIEVVLSGSAKNLQSINADNTKVQISLAGLSEGIHEIEPKISLPQANNVQIKGIPKINVELKKVPNDTE